MGFWSTLGKIGSIAGPLVAAPFTGGTSLLGLLGASAPVASAIGAGLGAAGRLASGASAQRAQDRGARTEFDLYNNAAYNRDMQSRTGQQNEQALLYAKARQDAERNRLRQIGSADMLGSSRPPTDSRAVLSGAGYMSPETIALMRDRAMKALESGSDVPELAQMPAYRETQMAQPGKMDSFLSALSMGGTAAGALREAGLLGGGQSAPVSQMGQVNLPPTPVGQLDDDDRPWWLKQTPAQMPYQYGKVNL